MSTPRCAPGGPERTVSLHLAALIDGVQLGNGAHTANWSRVSSTNVSAPAVSGITVPPLFGGQLW